MAHYSTSSSSSESEEYESDDQIRQPAYPATRRQNFWPPHVPSSPRTEASSTTGHRQGRRRRQGTIQFQNFFMPLSPGFTEEEHAGQERAETRIHESIRPATGGGHGFHYMPGVTRDGAGEGDEMSSEEEVESEDEDEDETTEPQSRPYPPFLSSAPRGRRAGHPPHGPAESDSDTESASDGDIESDEDESDEDEAPRRPTIHEPQTPHSRSRTGTRSINTPPRHNFTLSEIRARSQADCSSDAYSSDEDGLSIVHPSRYSDAASSPPRDCLLGRAGMDPRDQYPSPSPTEHDDLVGDFENLDCNHDMDERERWLRRQKAIKRAKRRSAGTIQKRTLSMSIGSDTDDEDVRMELGYEEQHDYGSASGLRRLRRRTMEGGNRQSLLFEDPPQRIPEVEEPETDAERHDRWSPPRRVPDMEAQGGMGWGNELPYWRGEMDVEY